MTDKAINVKMILLKIDKDNYTVNEVV